MHQNFFKQHLQFSPIQQTILIAILAATLVAAMGFSQEKPAEVIAPQASSTDITKTFEVDDVHSMALFRVQHLGAGRFWGLFNDVSGTIQYTPEKSLSMVIKIETASVDSNNEQLDRHLKSPDFFNSVEFPQMTFVSVSAKHIKNGNFEVVGDLSIRGVKKRVTVPFECTAISKLGGATRAGFEAEFEIKRSDFGVSYGVEKKMIGDETRIIVSLEGIEPGSAPKRKE
ncbi:MAG: YceI family protein [Planctomycetota bacterium]|nr:YceI family protein [Planctomycetota bacterium]